MIQEAINLNNDSIIYLQMAIPTEAYTLLSKASDIVVEIFKKQRQHPSSTKVSHEQYRYTWVDLPDAAKLLKDDRLDIPSGLSGDEDSLVLYRRALKVDDTHGHQLAGTNCSCRGHSDTTCPCGIAWVVWYNQALACCILGSAVGGEIGQQYLTRAYQLFELAMDRIKSKTTASKEWAMVKMAILNNQGYIFNKFSMNKEAKECLRQVKDVLVTMKISLGSFDYTVFCLNLLLLQPPQVASAA
jgi:hypothetical protein